MADAFETFSSGMESPPSRINGITPNDGEDLENASRAINVATSGTVRVTTVFGDTETLYVAAGIAFPIRAERIWATGTTATDIVVMF